MKLTIMTPSKQVFQGEMSEVYLPGFKGQFGILTGHAQMISKLCVGICRYRNQQGLESKLLLGKGVAWVFENEIRVLTDMVEHKRNINEQETKANLAQIDKKIVSSDTTSQEKENLLEEKTLLETRLDLISGDK